MLRGYPADHYYRTERCHPLHKVVEPIVAAYNPKLQYDSLGQAGYTICGLIGVG